MSADRAGKPSWIDAGFYPVQERLTKGCDATASNVFFIDRGGGLGHDRRELRQKHPNLPGTLILSDQPEVIPTITDTDSGIFEPTAHDFFIVQPGKHARAYFLHSVLHDWGDDD